MKSIHIKITAAYILALGMVSCGDSYLDTSSKTALNSNTFYKNELQASYAVIGCYDGYPRTVSNGSWPTLFLVSEFGGDDALGGGGPDDRSCRVMDRMDMSYNTSDVSFMSGLWGDYYKAINRCNQLLQQIDGVDFSSDDAKNAAKGEAMALRGLEYFDLVKLFEHVPLITSPTSEIVPQASPDSVYAQVVSDLKWAADNIPASYYTDKSSSLGRITCYAAGAMLARVYLFYDGVYNNNQRGTMPGGLTAAEALAYCEKAISSGHYKLETEFKDLWPAASTTPTAKAEGWKTTYKEASDEIVWVVKFNNDQDWNNANINGNRFIVDLGIRNVSDGSCAPYGNGWGQAPITRKATTLPDRRLPSRCLDHRPDQKRCLRHPDHHRCYGCDRLCEQEILSADLYRWLFHPRRGRHQRNLWGNFQTSQDQDWILMRYADVSLMAAELGSQKAMTYFNMVRERAFGDSSHNLSAAPTAQQVWDERRLEFMARASATGT
jgi:hypothetical protein